MGLICFPCEVAGIQAPHTWESVERVLVDTGSEFTWIPEPVLKQVGVTVVKKDLSFMMANGQTLTRSIGYALIRCQGFETVDEVVFGQPGDLSLLGAHTLEGFGAKVDPRTKLLVAAGPHIVARAGAR